MYTYMPLVKANPKYQAQISSTKSRSKDNFTHQEVTSMMYMCNCIIGEKSVGIKGILSPCLFNLHAEYIMRNAGWMEHNLETRLLGEISITSDMQMTTPLR